MLNFTELLMQLDHIGHRSGQELAAHFNVTRGTIHNGIERIEALGVRIERVPGLGYRLIEPLDLLDSQEIVNNLALPVANNLHILECLVQVDSTNQFAANLPNPPEGNFSAVISEMQTAGRGRRGREWVSPFAANIYLSIVWPLQRSLHEASIVSPYLAVCIVEKLLTLGIPELGLKWPNDIYCQKKKLAGLLIQCIGELSGASKMIIGLGLNVSMSRYRHASIDQEWTDICSNVTNWQCSRNKLAAELINALVDGMYDFENNTVTDLLSRWSRWDVMHNAKVDVLSDQVTQQGIARGIDEKGCLLLETKSGLRQILVGDVTLRPQL